MSSRPTTPVAAAPIKPSRSIDQESRRIIREELLTNILVEAGAGSGKTQMLAERMAAGVASGVYQIEHMAAVTFTRKAASELRGRFHLALEARVHAALGNLERFFAGTIHSFCARLLRERPVESGVSPGFSELDEQQDVELRKRAWRDFIANARSAGDPLMMELLEAGVKPKDLDPAFATICLNDDVEFPPGDGVHPDPRAAWKELERFWKELQKHLPVKLDPESSCDIQGAALKFQHRLRVDRTRVDRPAVMASLLALWDCESKITQNRWAESAADKKRFKELINPLHEGFRTDVVTPYLSQWRQYVYRLSVTLLMRAREHAAAERRRLNTLNYGDLLNLTAKVLRENPQVRRALQRKYRYLFVDEFQDTDPVQAEIVFLLAADEPTAGKAEAIAGWRTVSLRPGALFVVGDPKQSIYRFRRADIEIYNTVRERFSDPGIGRVLPLTRNFRSVPELCRWANEVFETRFPKEPTAYSPRFAALDPQTDTPSAGGVFTLTHPGDKKDVGAEDARRIATFIRTEVDAGRRKYSDFLILTRKKKDRIAPYAEALETLNVPIEVSGAGAFGESAEVKVLTTLLRAVADPQDALTLVAVLRGPLYGISDPELFAFKQSSGWFSIFASGPNPGSAAVGEALATLKEYYRWTRVLPGSAALERILEHTGYLALAATAPGGVQAGDLLHAVDRVRQVVEEGGSLSDAADSLEDDADDSSEVESLPLEPGRTDVVRLMNLHKAKGLEADVVFLADPCGGFKPRVDVHIERRGDVAQGWFEVVSKSEYSYASKLLGAHADWPQHELAEKPYLDAEQDRLLYVAATRARHMLVVSRWTGNQTQPAWGALNGFLASAKELPIPQLVAPPQPKALDCSIQAQLAAGAARVNARNVVREPSWSITSVTAEARHIARMTRAADAEPDDPTKVVSTDTPAHRADAGMAWGTLIHGLLEHAMRHKDASREDLRRLAMWLTVEEPQLRTVLDQAIETVQRVATAEFWQSAYQHEPAVETPFVAADAGRLTSGVIDLMFRFGEGWQIVDYKTDVALTPEMYQGQLDAYRAALRQMGCGVVDASVIDVRAERP